MKSHLRVGFVTTTDPRDKRSWSGTHHFMYRSLQECFETVEPLGPLTGGLVELRHKIVNRLLRKFSKRRISIAHSWALTRRYAAQIETRMRSNPVDVLVGSAASTAFAGLRTTTPSILVSDATFARMIDYYPAYSGLMPSSIRQGLAIERKALHRARYAVFCSAWAAESAVNDFELPRNRTHVMSFGPNLTKIPDRERALSRRDSATIRLLFLGVDWLRKGGPVALDTLRALLDRGKRASLTVCGCVPPSIESLPIEVIPFINKNTADGEARLIDLLCSHHFLLLPSLAECFGIVYCEAAACGTPSLAFNTGGIGGAITEGVSGHMIPVGSPGSVFADKITSLITHAEGYSALAASARDQYERSHNWRTWGESIANLIRSTHSDQKIKE